MAGSGKTARLPQQYAKKSGESAISTGNGNRRMPVERLLPDSLTDELRQEVGEATEITGALATELDKRLGIATGYAVSRQRLLTYLKRLHASSNGRGGGKIGSGLADGDQRDDWGDKVHAHRRRQVSVAAILDRTFGPPAQCNPDLWERRAYLMLVGLVYERLALNEGEIPTDELVALAKVLAEHRRADSNKRKDGQPKEPPTSAPSGQLPEQFADVVRQVYGANIETSPGADGTK